MKRRTSIKGAVALTLSLGLLLAGFALGQQDPPGHNPFERVYFLDEDGRWCVLHTRSSDPPVCQEISQTAEYLAPAWASYTNSAVGYRIDHPATWRVEEAAGGHEADIALDESVGMAIYAQPLEPDTAQVLSALPPDELGALMADGLRGELPDFHLVGIGAGTLAGAPASVIAFTATNGATLAPSTGRVIVRIHGTQLLVLVFKADTAKHLDYQGTFEQMLASLELTAVAERDAMICCPLPPDPFKGSFASETLTLTLQESNGHYTGQLVFGAQTFPVTAQASDGRLRGSFYSEGTAFGFTAALEGETLTFVTDGASYVLQKR